MAVDGGRAGRPHRDPAERIAQQCLKHGRPSGEVEVVVVHKPDAPITVPFDDVTVTITRSRV
ncbi:hypothetical protein GCM10020221_24850 [Streptomyces thioluteus]|uniref:Uncharacterized protein n=1 Tax=Streptomyces thioluteus TaxID=66431 RepID=A0ABN3WVX5_STRTU